MRKWDQVLCVSVLASLTPLALCQVSHSIDQDEDLLAVDSVDNEVSFRRPILPPPPSFAKVGARLVTAPRASHRGPQGPVKGQQQVAAVAGGHRAAVVHKNKMQADGSYAFNYETPDGQTRQETGKPSSSSAGSIVQAGGWSYTGQDGKLYEVKFVADELGYRPVGDHIHPAHQQAQRQARILSEQRQARGQRFKTSRAVKQEVRTRGQEVRTRGQEVQTRGQEVRTRGQEVRTRGQEVRTGGEAARTRGLSTRLEQQRTRSDSLKSGK